MAYHLKSCSAERDISFWFRGSINYILQALLDLIVVSVIYQLSTAGPTWSLQLNRVTVERDRDTGKADGASRRNKVSHVPLNPSCL